MSFFRSSGAGREAATGAVTMPDERLAELRPLDKKALKRRAREIDPLLDAFVAAGDRYARLEGPKAVEEEAQERLDAWRKTGGRDEPALILVRKRFRLRGRDWSLALDYLPLLRAALQASEGALKVGDLDRRLGDAPADKLPETAARVGLLCRRLGVDSAPAKAPTLAEELAARDEERRRQSNERSRRVLDDLAAGRRTNLGPLASEAAPAYRREATSTRSSSTAVRRRSIAIVTDFRALERVHGARGGRRLVDAIRAYADQCRQGADGGRVELVDLGSRPDLQNRPDRVKAHLDAILGSADKERGAPDAVQIIGGHAIVPHWAFRNPAHGLGDPDEFLLTDNPYGSEAPPPSEAGLGPELLPERVVGRFPDAAGGDGSTLLRQLENACAGVETTAPRPSAARRRLGAVAASLRSGDAVYERLGGGLDGLHIAPPFEGEYWSDSNDLASADYLYFQLHGTDAAPEWHGGDGQGGYSVALAPSNFAKLTLASGSTFLAEACFGAYAPGKTAEDSICLAALRAGAGRFFGSLNSAWTGLSESLTRRVIAALEAGATLPEALWIARVGLLSEAGGDATPLLLKTLASYVAYGDAAASSRDSAILRRAAEDARAMRRDLASGDAIRRVSNLSGVHKNFRDLEERARRALAEAGWLDGRSDSYPRVTGCLLPNRGGDQTIYYFKAARPGPRPGSERVALAELTARGDGATVRETTGFARRRA